MRGSRTAFQAGLVEDNRFGVSVRRKQEIKRQGALRCGRRWPGTAPVCAHSKSDTYIHISINVNIRRPRPSQSLGGEAPETPQGATLALASLPLLSCPGTTTKPWTVHVLAEPPPRGLLAFLSRMGMSFWQCQPTRALTPKPPGLLHACTPLHRLAERWE